MTDKTIVQVVTANDLVTGEVVYLAKDGSWVGSLSSAAYANVEEANRLLEIGNAKQDQIVGAYLVDMQLDEFGNLKPDHFREEFRTRGPSNYFHGKQAVA